MACAAALWPYVYPKPSRPPAAIVTTIIVVLAHSNVPSDSGVSVGTTKTCCRTSRISGATFFLSPVRDSRNRHTPRAPAADLPRRCDRRAAWVTDAPWGSARSEEHTSELQSPYV